MIQHPFSAACMRPCPTVAALWAVFAALSLFPAGAPGQEASTEGPAAQGVVEEGLSPEEIAEKAEAALEDGGDEATETEETADVPTPTISILDLLFRGGWLMLPIIAMSFLVVAFGVERALGLRRGRVFPIALQEGLEEFIRGTDRVDPNQLVELCRQYPSSAATVLKAGLRRLGKPLADLEKATSDAENREADRLYTNVRWLSLAAGVTPLLGLLGTVWGMINAFFVTANLPTGANKAEYLADGIYVALVTTFAGLGVAIPAAVLAHFFEGRIQSLFRLLNETLFRLLPRLEKFEGRVRHESPARPTKGGEA